MAADSLLTTQARLADIGVHDTEAWTVGELLRPVRARTFESNPSASELLRRVRETLPNRVPEVTGSAVSRTDRDSAYQIAGKYASVMQSSEEFAADKASEIARGHRRG